MRVTPSEKIARSVEKLKEKMSNDLFWFVNFVELHLEFSFQKMNKVIATIAQTNESLWKSSKCIFQMDTTSTINTFK